MRDYPDFASQDYEGMMRSFEADDTAREGSSPFYEPLTEELRQKADLFITLGVQVATKDPVRLDAEIVQVYGPIEGWCVGNIKDFSRLFSTARKPVLFAFNLDISSWNMSAATNTSYMLAGNFFTDVTFLNQNISVGENKFIVKSKFNRDISSWDVGRVVDMSGMFAGSTAFNQSLSNWDTSSGTLDRR